MPRVAKKSVVEKALELAVKKLNSEIQRLTAKRDEIDEEIESVKTEREKLHESLASAAETAIATVVSESETEVATN